MLPPLVVKPMPSQDLSSYPLRKTLSPKSIAARRANSLKSTGPGNGKRGLLAALMKETGAPDLFAIASDIAFKFFESRGWSNGCIRAWIEHQNVTADARSRFLWGDLGDGRGFPTAEETAVFKFAFLSPNLADSIPGPLRLRISQFSAAANPRRQRGAANPRR